MNYQAEHQATCQYQTHEHSREQLAAIHIMKTKPEFDDESYRDILESITGHHSSKDMSRSGRINFSCIIELSSSSGFARRNLKAF